MLTTQLGELEEDGIIERKIYAQVPLKVEYSISKRGQAFSARVLRSMETASHRSWPISSPTFSGEKRLSPRRASAADGSLLPLSPRRTQVRLRPLLNQVSGHRQIYFRPRGGLC